MITGTVEGASKKEVKTKFGMKPTFSLKIDGEWYSCGFTDPRCSSGDVIAFTYTDTKYGREIDKGSIMKTGAAVTPPAESKPTYTGTTSAPKSAAAPNRPFPIPPLHGDRAIIRQNALSHASRLAAAYIQPGTVYLEDTLADTVIRLARKFEAYACGDLDVERAKEMAIAKELKGE